jgi:hypothetical protein
MKPEYERIAGLFGKFLGVSAVVFTGATKSDSQTQPGGAIGWDTAQHNMSKRGFTK